jgi:hypothetical protein
MAKKPSTALTETADVGVKWNVDPEWCSRANVWVLVGGVVVNDGVDRLAGGSLLLDDTEEANEFLTDYFLIREPTCFEVRIAKAGWSGSVNYDLNGQKYPMTSLLRSKAIILVRLRRNGGDMERDGS